MRRILQILVVFAAPVIEVIEHRAQVSAAGAVLRAGHQPRLPRAIAVKEVQAVVMGACGLGMLVVMWVAGPLGLGLLASLMVPVWVLVGRARQEPIWRAPAAERERR